MKSLKTIVASTAVAAVCVLACGATPVFAYTYGQGYYGMGDGAHKAAEAVQAARDAASKINYSGIKVTVPTTTPDTTPETTPEKTETTTSGYQYGQGYYGIGDGAHKAAEAMQAARNAASKISAGGILR